MCLAVPGEILSIREGNGLPEAEVSFGGIRRKICLAYTPEARVNDFVLVHVGFAISRIDKEEARRVLDYLRQFGEIDAVE